jgi:hypothetical protein
MMAAKTKKMVSGKGVSKLFSFIAWLTGVIVSLSVGFAMIGGTLTLPYYFGGAIVANIAGYIVVITTVIGAVLAILNK